MNFKKETIKCLKSNNLQVKLLLIAILFVLSGQSLFGQYFLKSYDFPTYMTMTEIGRSIEPVTVSSPYGWTIAGFSNSTPAAGGYNWMFLKLNSLGTFSCATLLGFPHDDSCFSHVKFAGSPVNVLAGFYTMTSPSGLKEKASWSMVDTSCTHLMTKMISDTARHQYRWVTRTPANTFTLTGYIQRYGHQGGAVDHILASQYSSGGALLWAYEYFPPGPGIIERAYSICYQPTDGSYAITGVTNRFTGPGGALQVFIFKISSAGVGIWFKGYSPITGAKSDSRKIVALPDGGFAVAGWSSAYDPANDIWIFKVDAAGTPVWSNTYGLIGTSVREESYGLIYQLSDASLVFTGLRTASEDIILGKVTEASGTPVWYRTYPNTAGMDRGYDLEEAIGPSGYAVTGQLYASSSTSLDPFLMRTNFIGNISSGCMDSLMVQPRQGIWNDTSVTQLLELFDVIVQPQVVNPNPQVRILCEKIMGVGENQNSIAKEFSLKQNFPNPFNPSTVISYQLAVNSFVTLKIYDVLGKEVAVLVNEELKAGTYEIEWPAFRDASKFTSGVYFYTLEANGFTDTKKMMLVK